MGLPDTSTSKFAAPVGYPSPSQSLTPGVKKTSILRDYWSLTKPEITLLVVMSAVAGFLLGSGVGIAYPTLLALCTGVALTSAGGAALNLILERDHDRSMRRTADRPMPSGRIQPGAAYAFSFITISTGLLILWVFTNALTTVLATLTIFLYIVLYTPLKRKTRFNTLVGTIPGALPALGGWTAATGDFGLGGWLIFGILLVWQLPHFFALAWMYRKDYGRAGFRMLPVEQPDGKSTAFQITAASVVLTLLAVLPSFFGYTSWFYMAGALTISLWLLQSAIAFGKDKSNPRARTVLKRSVVHIPVLVSLIILDKLLGL